MSMSNDVLHLIDKAVHKDQHAWRRNHPGQAERRFPHYAVGRITARKIVAATGVAMPKRGREVTVGFDPRHGVEWKMMNKAGNFFLAPRWV